MSIKSRRDVEVDTEAVRKLLTEAKDWTATCPVCHVTLTGSIAELKAHKHGE